MLGDAGDQHELGGVAVSWRQAPPWFSLLATGRGSSQGDAMTFSLPHTVNAKSTDVVAASPTSCAQVHDVNGRQRDVTV